MQQSPIGETSHQSKSRDGDAVRRVELHAISYCSLSRKGRTAKRSV